MYCCTAFCRLLTCEVLDAGYHAIADLRAFAAKDERSEILRWLFGSEQYARQTKAALAAIERKDRGGEETMPTSLLREYRVGACKGCVQKEEPRRAARSDVFKRCVQKEAPHACYQPGWEAGQFETLMLKL